MVTSAELAAELNALNLPVMAKYGTDGKPAQFVPDGNLYVSIQNVSMTNVQEFRDELAIALSMAHLLRPNGDKQITFPNKAPLLGKLSSKKTYINISASALISPRDVDAEHQQAIKTQAAKIHITVGTIKSAAPDPAATLAVIANLLGTTVDDACFEVARRSKMLDKDPDQRKQLTELMAALKEESRAK